MYQKCQLSYRVVLVTSILMFYVVQEGCLILLVLWVTMDLLKIKHRSNMLELESLSGVDEDSCRELSSENKDLMNE